MILFHYWQVKNFFYKFGHVFKFLLHDLTSTVYDDVQNNSSQQNINMKTRQIRKIIVYIYINIFNIREVKIGEIDRNMIYGVDSECGCND